MRIICSTYFGGRFILCSLLLQFIYQMLFVCSMHIHVISSVMSLQTGYDCEEEERERFLRQVNTVCCSLVKGVAQRHDEYKFVLSAVAGILDKHALVGLVKNVLMCQWKWDEVGHKTVLTVTSSSKYPVSVPSVQILTKCIIRGPCIVLISFHIHSNTILWQHTNTTTSNQSIIWLSAQMFHIQPFSLAIFADK